MTNVRHRTGPEAPVFHEVAVIEGSARRRSWSREEKARIVAESLDPVVSVSAVARRHGLNPNQLFTWRRQVRDEAAHWRGACDVGGPGPEGMAASTIDVILGAVTVRVGPTAAARSGWSRWPRARSASCTSASRAR